MGGTRLGGCMISCTAELSLLHTIAFSVKILLPIFCVLTIVVFVGMAVFAHYYFPYIDSKGEKRHKKKPQT